MISKYVFAFQGEGEGDDMVSNWENTINETSKIYEKQWNKSNLCVQKKGKKLRNTLQKHRISTCMVVGKILSKGHSSILIKGKIRIPGISNKQWRSFSALGKWLLISRAP